MQFDDSQLKYIHFLGIGGAGMNPLARLACQQDYHVSGSDKQSNNFILELIDDFQLNIQNIWTNKHCQDNLHQYIQSNNILSPKIICVASTAIPKDNAEILYCKKNNIQVIHRSDLLEYFASKADKEIVITGTHGKTTTTALVTWICQQANLNPSWLIGSTPKNIKASHWNNKNNIFIYEGDESDKSFLKSNPDIGIITCIEPDHLENYNNSFDEQKAEFQKFKSKCKILIDASQDNNLLMTEFQAIKDSIILENLFGEHNKFNAFLAMKACQYLDININEALEYIKTFPGLYRRFEYLPVKNFHVFDDYAHHPTEVEEAIKAGRQYIIDKQLNNSRLIICFQPHLPTRFQAQWTKFLHCFQNADILIFLDLYLARGQHIDNINSQTFVKELENIYTKDLTYCPGKPYNIIKVLNNKIQSDDVILLLGAGDITTIREQLIQSLSLFEII